MLAFESSLALAIMALAFAATQLLFWRQTRARYLLFWLAGWLVLCIYWSLLAVSAGPAPVIARGDIALIVRLLGLAAVFVMLSGLLLLLLCLRRNGKQPDTEDST